MMAVKKGIQMSLNDLDKKLEEYKDNEEMIKLIKSAKRRIKIHKHNVFEKRGDVKLSIIFPQSVYMKTKKVDLILYLIYMKL